MTYFCSFSCIKEKLKGIPQSNCAALAAGGKHTGYIGTNVRMSMDDFRNNDIKMTVAEVSGQ